jgi:hypothetical protein
MQLVKQWGTQQALHALQSACLLLAPHNIHKQENSVHLRAARFREGLQTPVIINESFLMRKLCASSYRSLLFWPYVTSESSHGTALADC